MAVTTSLALLVVAAWLVARLRRNESMSGRRIRFVVLSALVGCSGSEAHRTGGSGSLAASSSPEVMGDSGALAARLAGIDVEIETNRRRLGVPGVAVGIVTPDRLVFAKGFGLRDVEHNLPVTPTTRFAIGSCTKPFTALATILAAEERLLSVDDSPRRFLPYFHLREATADAQVTLRDLLSHRTGVPDDLGGGWYERYGTAEGLIRRAMASAPRGSFRQVFHYNNYLYSAAGEALAVARGRPYGDVVRQTVFEPLGMRSSGLSLDEMEASADFAYGYEGSARARIRPTRLVWATAIAPAANINSNVHDMARWLRMLVGGGVIDGTRIVSSAGLNALLEPEVRTSGGSYALGWFVEQWHGMRLYSHPGGVTGYGTRCEFLPDQGLGWVILTNVDDQALPKAIHELIYTHLLAPR